jgi:hypothetical protein
MVEQVGPENVPGWRREGEIRQYDPETLYDLVNGAADLYFSYGFQQASVTLFVDADGKQVQVERYDLRTDADAYGLFTYLSYGEPIDLGVDGERDPGYRLAFWQDRTFVQILARDAVDDDALRELGVAVVETLPPGGQHPALVDALPEEGLQPGSVRFFREKLALDNLLWLGPDDVLGLGPETEGVVARYERDGQIANLLLVTFPDAERAENAQTSLQEAEVEELVTTLARDTMVGAVLGTVSLEVAEALLMEALGGGS